MSTKFYLPSTAASPDISPTPSSGWENTGSMVRLKMSPDKANTTMTTKTVTIPNIGKDTLFHQYIYGPLAPVTVAANVVWTLWVRGQESNGNLNGFPSVGIWIADSTGALRGTIMAGGTTGQGAEFGLSLAGRDFRPASLTNSSISVQGGDYLVLEVGVAQTGGTTGLTAGLSFGDDSASDLASTSSTADNPVFIIDTDFTLFKPGARAYIMQ